VRSGVAVLPLLRTAPRTTVPEGSAWRTHASEGIMAPVGERPKPHQLMGVPGVLQVAAKAMTPFEKLQGSGGGP
jgi:hypothetical protein